MRSDYKVCPLCGAVLDIGEKCDCMEQKEPKNEKIIHYGSINKKAEENENKAMICNR